MSEQAAHILIVEDDADIAELIRYNLTREGMRVTVLHDGLAASEQAPVLRPNLIVLDLMLPGMSGLDVCRQLKEHDATAMIPIIMVTARSEELDRVVGFEAGADDYLTKPFSARELTLRVQAVLKRVGGSGAAPQSALYTHGILSLDTEKFRVQVAGEVIKLTAIEFRLLQYFLERPGVVATRDVLLNDVWGYDAMLTTRTVDTHVKRLREKLGVAGQYIETVRSVGYRLQELAGDA